MIINNNRIVLKTRVLIKKYRIIVIIRSVDAQITLKNIKKKKTNRIISNILIILYLIISWIARVICMQVISD